VKFQKKKKTKKKNKNIKLSGTTPRFWWDLGRHFVLIVFNN
jgi:hypothetical protein